MVAHRCRAWAIVGLIVGCSGRRAPPAHEDHARAPLAAVDAGAPQDPATTAGLRAIAERAARDPAAYPDFRFSYERGHALWGVTRFEVSAAGAYALESDETAGRRRRFHAAGQLRPRDRDSLLAAIRAARLFDMASSSRRLGDDEEPVIVVMSHGTMTHRLMLCGEDADANPRFDRLESLVQELVRQLSGGAVRPSGQ